MQTSVNEVSERLVDEMPVSEPGHSLIALLQVQAVAAEAEQRVMPAENWAAQPIEQADTVALAESPVAFTESPVALTESPVDMVHDHAVPAPKGPHPETEATSQGLAMLELNEAIAKMLELLNKRLHNLEPQEISLKSLEPLAKSLTEAFGELKQSIHDDDGRQSATMESALKQREWDSNCETKDAKYLIEIKAIRVKAKLEIDRILRAMWLGTGIAAACTAAALYLFRN